MNKPIRNKHPLFKIANDTDSAIIFIKSNSKFAPKPAINIVSPETNNKITFNQKLKKD
jgi:hypothetical protein